MMLPDIPDDDADFTPELARKIITLYQSEITRLRAREAKLMEGLRYYADNEIYDGGDVPGHIYVIDDHGRTARSLIQEDGE